MKIPDQLIRDTILRQKAVIAKLLIKLDTYQRRQSWKKEEKS
jgi:hypothetical protein